MITVKEIYKVCDDLIALIRTMVSSLFDLGSSHLQAGCEGRSLILFYHSIPGSLALPSESAGVGVRILGSQPLLPHDTHER